MSPLNRFWRLALRDAGRPVPRWQQATAEWREGLLRVREERDPLTGRTMLVARLFSVSRVEEVVPPLMDAKLVQVTDERIVLTGMERDDLKRIDTAQAWLLLKGREKPQGAGQT